MQRYSSTCQRSINPCAYCDAPALVYVASLACRCSPLTSLSANSDLVEHLRHLQDEAKCNILCLIYTHVAWWKLSLPDGPDLFIDKLIHAISQNTNKHPSLHTYNAPHHIQSSTKYYYTLSCWLPDVIIEFTVTATVLFLWLCSIATYLPNPAS
jgi:hypothetical protein